MDTSQYVYRLGHQPQIALSEMKMIDPSAQFDHEENWAVGSKVDFERSGSITSAGPWLAASESKEEIFDELANALNEYRDTSRKIGLWIEGSGPRKNLIKLAKTLGYKQVNIIPEGKAMNYGHWKSCKHWFAVFHMKNQWVLSRIEFMADQQTWSHIDLKLTGDMRRGLMNLKLARTLLNFASKDIVWDPFCGHGRVLVGGLDLHKHYLASDIDSKCVPDVDVNWEEGTYQWNKRHDVNSKLVDSWVQSASDHKTSLHKLDVLGIDPTSISVVTEGYLGYNPGRHLLDGELEEQYTKLAELWDAILGSYAQMNIPDATFCLPAYAKTKRRPFTRPEFIKELITKHGYSLTHELIYSRPKSFVAHAIFRIERSQSR